MNNQNCTCETRKRLCEHCKKEDQLACYTNQICNIKDLECGWVECEYSYCKARLKHDNALQHWHKAHRRHEKDFNWEKHRKELENMMPELRRRHQLFLDSLTEEMNKKRAENS